MKIAAPVNLIPDLVEELTVDQSGKALDTDWLRLILNEFDDHAVEQAILLKEKLACEVIVIAPDVEGADDVLFTAAAKGADRLVKLTQFGVGVLNNHVLARALTPVLKELAPDVVLTGVQAHNDLDGQLGPLLAEFLGFPYIGYISSVSVKNGRLQANKEYPGGLVARMEAQLPVVLGIQAAEQPPRYIAFSKVRQARTSAVVEDIQVSPIESSGGPEISRMFQPEVAQRAEMISGSAEEIAAKFFEIITQEGILP